MRKENLILAAQTSRIRMLPRLGLLLRHDFKMAWRYVCRWYSRWWWVSAICLVLSLLLVLLCHPADAAVLQAVKASNKGTSYWVMLARELSYLGDFLGFTTMSFAVLWLAGVALRSRRLMRVAVASLLCASLAGMAANVTRVLTGRPRPCTKLADQLTGPSLDGGRHALPSAHTATAFGTALPVLASLPGVGAPLTVVASGVAWSRMQLERHRLTDVLVSVCLAYFFSVPLSHWVLQHHPRAHRPRSSPPEFDAEAFIHPHQVQ